MTVIPLGAITPIYFIGGSHCLGFNNIAFRPALAQDLFACRTCFLRSIPASEYSLPDGSINPDLLAAFRTESLLDNNNRPEYLTRTSSIAFLSGLPVIAPPMVMLEGESEIRKIFAQLGNEYDFILPDDALYGHDKTKQYIPLKIVRDNISLLLQPFFAVTKVLRTAGFKRLMLHGLPPRVFDDARSALWTVKNAAICAPIRAKTALLANQILAEFCAAHDIGYVDVWMETISDAGYLRPEFDLDGLHVGRESTLLSLDKVTAILFDQTGHIHNESRYAQLCARAPRVSDKKPNPCDTEYKERGVTVAKLTISDLPAAVTKLTFSMRENAHARPDWVGAPRAGIEGFIHARPTEKILQDSESLLRSEEAQLALHAGSDLALTVSSLRPLRVEPGIFPSSGYHRTTAPNGARYGVIGLTAGLVLVLEAIDGSRSDEISIAPGTLLVYDPTRVRAQYKVSSGAAEIIELALIPRLPNEPFRVNWAGLNDWPADPFQYSIHDMCAWPPQVGTMVRERSRTKELEIPKRSPPSA